MASERDRTGVAAALREAVTRLVACLNPERIIIFGSQARSDAGPESDIDLLVVLRDEQSVGLAEDKAYRVLADLEVPVDVVAVNARFLETYGDLVGTVTRTALREGKVLYAR
ncbi:MAG: nucleotidyltransferase domain-containing protein [Anaerolineae bacterium]|nr:nucleotidyltransferase domain-containing protein [Anaerolineae bacterium]